jgi:hypothetical protein
MKRFVLIGLGLAAWTPLITFANPAPQRGTVQ